MMRPLQNKLVIALLTLLPTIALALPSDSKQPISIEADHAQLDDKQGITQYKGKAVLTQGSLRIEGDIITFYYDEDKQISKAIAQGKPATYQQIQNPGEKPVKARALQMEYHAKKQKIYLIGQGHVWQNGDEFSGGRIEYDIANNIVNANSSPVKVNGKTQKSERVHIIIQPPGSKKKPAKSPIKKKKVSPVPTVTSEDVATEKDNSYPTAITSSRLNIRTGPGTQYDKLGIFNIGSELIILTEQKSWIQVRGMINGQIMIGWVNRRFVQAR